MSNYCWLYTVGLHEDIGTDFAIMVEETTGQAPTRRVLGNHEIHIFARVLLPPGYEDAQKVLR